MRSIILAVLLAAAAAAPSPARTIVHAGHLIDGVSKTSRAQVSVVIADGRIADVVSGFMAPG